MMNYKLLFILFLTSLTLSCTTQPSLNPDCCIECVNAFSQSPVAVGPSAAACGHFMSGYSMSTQCEEYFRDAAVTVDDCER